MSVNRLITRGMGRNYQNAGNSGMITSGMGGFFQNIVNAVITPAKSLIRYGGSSAKKIVNDVTIWIKLLFVNDEPTKQLIQGMTSTYSTISSERVSIEKVSTTVVRDRYLVKATRIARTNNGNN